MKRWLVRHVPGVRPVWRWLLNRKGRLLGYGGCHHCGNSWLWATAHVTHYGNPPVAGMFVICEPCWRKVTFGTALRYYACQHMRWWAAGLESGHKPPPWRAIERALRAECMVPEGFPQVPAEWWELWPTKEVGSE